MSTQEERRTIIHNYPIYRALSILVGIVIAGGLIFAMAMSNGASDLLAGTKISSLMGLRVNEKTTLSVLIMASVLCAFIVFLQHLYFVAKEKAVTPVL